MIRSLTLALSLLLFTACTDTASERPATAPPPTVEAPGAAATSAVEPASIGSVPRLTRSGNLFFAGQPAPDDLPALREAGVTRIINLRHQAEMGGFDEAAAARANGIEYVSLPWNGPSELTDAVIDRARELLISSDETTLVHCASSNRVGAVWLPFRVLDQGVPLEQAVAEARDAGMRSPEYEAVARDYIARHR